MKTFRLLMILKEVFRKSVVEKLEEKITPKKIVKRVRKG